MAKNLFQLHIQLKYSKPKIWRRLLVPSDILLPVFHHIIQITMGWDGGHLHQFIADGVYYSEKMEGDDFWDDAINVDYKKVKLSHLLHAVKEKIIYEYDFGDGWNHIITLEKILPGDESMKHPVCLAGKMSCPPEDCGGIGGYADLLDAINNPNRSDREEILEWLDEDFDPNYFDLEKVNESLKYLRFGK